MAKYKSRFYPESNFGGFTDVDGSISFFTRVNALLDPDFVVLDVGCGRGRYSEDLVTIRKNLRGIRGKVAKVIGIDVDQNAQDNPFLDEFHLLQGDDWPIESNSVDLVICDFVMEHVADPDLFFSEFSRVLKDDGYLCIRTPNRWSYVALAAMLVPNSLHAKVLSKVQKGRKEADIFPTHYRCNSVRKLRSEMRKHGFESAVYGFASEPAYLSFSGIAYYLGVLYQRFVPGIFQPLLFAFGRLKQSSSSPANRG